MKGKSITFELALEPVVIEAMLPKWTFAVCCDMLGFHLLRGNTIDTVLLVLVNLDIQQVVDLRMRPPTERAVCTLRMALVGMVAPLLAPSVQKGTGIGFGSSDAAVYTAEGNELTYEGSHIGATQGLVDVDPCCA
jgi:hypothetical protein